MYTKKKKFIHWRFFHPEILEHTGERVFLMSIYKLKKGYYKEYYIEDR